MNRNKIILIILIVLVIIIAIIVFKKQKFNPELETGNQKITSLDRIPYDEETGLYYIKDEKTGEIIGASSNKENLQFYIDNPDYNPTPFIPRSTTLEEYIEHSTDENYDIRNME